MPSKRWPVSDREVEPLWFRIWNRVCLAFVAFCVLVLVLAALKGWVWAIAKASADHGGPTFEHECPLPDGDPRGWPCTHTEPNGQKFIDWSQAYIDDRRYPMVPVEAP